MKINFTVQIDKKVKSKLDFLYVRAYIKDLKLSKGAIIEKALLLGLPLLAEELGLTFGAITEEELSDNDISKTE